MHSARAIRTCTHRHTDTPGPTSTCVIVPWNQTRTLTIVTLGCQEFARGPALRDVSRHRAYTHRDTYQIRCHTHTHLRTYTYTPAHIHVHTCAPTRTHLRTYTYTPAHIHVPKDTESVCFGPIPASRPYAKGALLRFLES